MASKKDLVKKVAASVEDLSKKDATVAVDTVFSALTEYLTEGERVQIFGFGTFEVRERAERKGRNPQTGEELVIAAAKAAAFKPSSALKKAVRGK